MLCKCAAPAFAPIAALHRCEQAPHLRRVAHSRWCRTGRPRRRRPRPARRPCGRRRLPAHAPCDRAAERGGHAGLDRHAAARRSLRSATMRRDLVDHLRARLAHVGQRVRLAGRHRQRQLVHAGGERRLGTAQVRHQRHHGEARHASARARRPRRHRPSAAAAWRGTNEPTSISRRPAACERVDPAQLARGRHRALDALQPVARADFADQDRGCFGTTPVAVVLYR